MRPIPGRLLDEARRLVSIDSIGENGNEELANFLAHLLQERGIQSELQQVMHSRSDISKRQFNVVGIIGDPLVDRKTRKGFLLTSHLDTSPTGRVTKWTDTAGDPFQLQTQGEKVIGLGAADAKLDFLCKIFAAQGYIEKKLKMPIYLVGTAGEGIGMLGCKYILQSLRLNPQYVLVGKPTDLKIVHGDKKEENYRLKFGYHIIEKASRGFNRKILLYSYGRTAHAAYPEDGQSALTKLFKFLEDAVESGFDIKFTKISGGKTATQVPDEAMAEFYLTSHELEDFKRFFREKTEESDETESSFRIELGGVGDAGIAFLPDEFFACLLESWRLVEGLGATLNKTKDDSYDREEQAISIGKLELRRDGADLVFSASLFPATNLHDDARTEVQKLASKYSTMNLVLSKDTTHPGLEADDGSDFVALCGQTLAEIDEQPNIGKASFTSEAGQYAAKGYETLIFGPGPIRGNSRCPNEYNLLDQMQRATAFYEKIIEKVCL